MLGLSLCFSSRRHLLHHYHYHLLLCNAKEASSWEEETEKKGGRTIITCKDVMVGTVDGNEHEGNIRVYLREVERGGQKGMVEVHAMECVVETVLEI